MDSHFDPHDAGAFIGGAEFNVQDDSNAAWRGMPAEDTPKPRNSEEAGFHILWFSAAMLGMPALIAALALLF